MFHPSNFPTALMFLSVCISRLRKPTILHKHLRDSLRTTDWRSRWPYVLFASYTIDTLASYKETIVIDCSRPAAVDQLKI